MDSSKKRLNRSKYRFVKIGLVIFISLLIGRTFYFGFAYSGSHECQLSSINDGPMVFKNNLPKNNIKESNEIYVLPFFVYFHHRGWGSETKNIGFFLNIVDVVGIWAGFDRSAFVGSIIPFGVSRFYMSSGLSNNEIIVSKKATMTVPKYGGLIGPSFSNDMRRARFLTLKDLDLFGEFIQKTSPQKSSELEFVYVCKNN